MPTNREEYEEFELWGVKPPVSQAHGTEKDIRRNMEQLMPHSWRQEGDRLIGQTEVGELSQKIPTNLILKGTDSKGLPILEKIKLK